MVQLFKRNGCTKIRRIIKTREEKKQKRCSKISISRSRLQALPECLIYEILSWLPVKSLLRFKTVCKSWRSTIESRDFVSKHVSQQRCRYNADDDEFRDCLIVQYSYNHYNSLESHRCFLNEKHNKVIASSELDDIPIDYCQLCGPCDGLYYLWKRTPFHDNDYLWNPALNELKKLTPLDVFTRPNSAANLKKDTYNAGCGFGFDPVTLDYKVVIVRGFMDGSVVYSRINENIPPFVTVYSLRTNSWRYVTDLPKFYKLKDNESYIFAYSSLYWLATAKLSMFERNYQLIIAFDLATNKCREIELPKGRIQEKNTECECLMIYQGDMTYVTFDYDNNMCLDVWALVDEGCWAKKLTMGLDYDVGRPLGQWRDGLLAFVRSGTSLLTICNLDTQKTNWFKSVPYVDHSYFRCVVICAYKESLLSLYN